MRGTFQLRRNRSLQFFILRYVNNCASGIGNDFSTVLFSMITPLNDHINAIAAIYPYRLVDYRQHDFTFY